MNLWIYVVLLAVVQGLTEFLPVSSSGHLAILGNVFGIHESDSLSFGIVLHAGSLVAILVVYFREIWKIIRLAQWRVVLMLVIATIPAGVAGVLLKHFQIMDNFFGDPLLVGGALLVTGALLRLTGRKKLTEKSEGPNGTKLENISLWQAVTIGFVQMGAIIPGISRSGSTITVGVLCGIERKTAATFSFLLALPVIGGATLLEVIDLAEKNWTTSGYPVTMLLLGFAISALVSLGALLWLLKIVRAGRLCWFSWYLFAIGVVIIIWQLCGNVAAK